MAHRWLAANFILMVLMFAPAQCRAQTNEPLQAADAVALPAPLWKIVTKDPAYLKLLNPPKGNDFLRTYSKSYRDASAELDAKFAGIPDENLRRQARSDEWAKVSERDGDKFWFDAETTFRDAKISFSRNHRDGWYEAGRVFYDQNNSVLAMAANSTTPIDASFRFPMKAATLNQVYEKFHQSAAQEIAQKAHEYVSKSETGSTCSKNPDLCYGFAQQEIEQSLRSERIVVVAQGDMENGRIDRLILVDYNTEAVLLDLDASASTLGSAAWRFTAGPVPVMPEPASADAHVQPAPADSSPAGVSVPANVTAATIIERKAPEYPSEARAKNIQGEVVLHAVIDKKGKVSQLQVLSGDDLLAQSALEAVPQGRYKPMLVEGEPRESGTTITVTFSLQE